MKNIFILVFTLSFMPSVWSQAHQHLYKMADSLRKQKLFKESISYYNQAIMQDSSRKEYFLGRAKSFLEIKNYTTSLKDIKKVLTLDPNCGDCYLLMGDISTASGQYQEAIAFAQKAIKLNPEGAGNYYVFMAQRYKQLNQKKEALACFQKAIETDPKNPSFYLARAYFALEKELYFLAKRDLDLAVKKKPEDHNIRYKKVQFYTQIQDWETASTDIQICIQQDSTNAVYHDVYGTILQLQGDLTKSLRHLNTSVRLDSTVALTYSNRSQTHFLLEDMNAYCNDQKMVLKWYNQDSIKNNIIVIKYTKTAIDNFCNPSTAEYYYQRGIAAYNRKDYDKAIEHYKKGVEKFPTNSVLLSFEGNAYMKAELYKLALKSYLKALKYRSTITDEFKNNTAHTLSGMTMDHLSNSKVLIGNVLYSAAQAYLMLDDLTNAKNYIDSSITILSKLPLNTDLDDGVRIRFQLGACYALKAQIIFLKENKSTDALKLLDRATYYSPEAIYDVQKAMLKLSIEESTKHHQHFFADLMKIKGTFPTPPFYPKSDSDIPLLEEVLTHCNLAIRKNPQYAKAYYLRAYVKKRLSIDEGVCTDAQIAQTLEFEHAIKQLGLDCKE